MPLHGNCRERPPSLRSDRPGCPRHRGGQRHRPHHVRGSGRCRGHRCLRRHRCRARGRDGARHRRRARQGGECADRRRPTRSSRDVGRTHRGAPRRVARDVQHRRHHDRQLHHRCRSGRVRPHPRGEPQGRPVRMSGRRQGDGGSGRRLHRQHGLDGRPGPLTRHRALRHLQGRRRPTDQVDGRGGGQEGGAGQCRRAGLRPHQHDGALLHRRGRNGRRGDERSCAVPDGARTFPCAGSGSPPTSRTACCTSRRTPAATSRDR